MKPTIATLCKAQIVTLLFLCASTVAIGQTLTTTKCTLKLSIGSDATLTLTPDDKNSSSKCTTSNGIFKVDGGVVVIWKIVDQDITSFWIEEACTSGNCDVFSTAPARQTGKQSWQATATSSTQSTPCNTNIITETYDIYWVRDGKVYKDDPTIQVDPDGGGGIGD